MLYVSETHPGMTSMPDTQEQNPLARFHPLIREWFGDRFDTATDIQARTWPLVANNRHVLVTAPTGSGKTLTAFLWAINSFVTKKPDTPSGRVLYISPLKALNNDIRRNLEEPLESLRELFGREGAEFPDIRVAVRSGDTEQGERRRHLKHPPDIYITTPESLSILLASKSGKRLLEGIGTVILDEIHAVAATKRGSYLMAAVERLTEFSGEFQRIALSATVKPMETIAAFIGGYRLFGDPGEPTYEQRDVAIVRSSDQKQYKIRIDFPDSGISPDQEQIWWHEITDKLREEIAANRSTLIFANSRRMVEKITRFINERESEQAVYSHHGSLSREIREVVEQRLKAGELKAIVATSSLELGIDIGSVDSVVLVQMPYSIASSIQRIGRAGHGVGQVSKGSFVPIHSRDLVQSAVLSDFIRSEDIETVSPVEQPLDVLAQLILSMTLHEERDVDELYSEIRASWAFHRLPRRDFDIVIEMLAGRYADSRIRELKPRIRIDRIGNAVVAADNVAPLIYLSGGVIPDRGYYNLRVADSKALIGELDEEFVWERSLGESFPFGNGIWQIVKITHNDVEVRKVKGSNTLIPFWRAEDMNRSWHFSEKIGEFLEDAETAAEDGGDDFRNKLALGRNMSGSAAESLAVLLERQIEACAVLPHRHRIVVEHFRDPANISDTKQTVIHTMWGGSVNRPLSFAIAAAWEEKYGYTLEVFADNDCIMLNLPHEFTSNEILNLAEPRDIIRLLRKRLESTGYFGARFRENAQRALLLPRRSFHDRMPLWLNRLRSKKLLEAVSRYDDFPIVLETWRECLNADFDLTTLGMLLTEISEGLITVSEVETRTPSPFASQVIWRQTNFYMYEDDSPAAGLKSSLSDELLRELIDSEQLRPRFSEELIASFTAKIQRTAPGYTPDSPGELLDWVKERRFIPADEWKVLLAAIERDHGPESRAFIDDISDRLFFFSESGIESAVCALEELPQVSSALGIAENEALEVEKRLRMKAPENTDDPPLLRFLGEWLKYYGPVSSEVIADILPFDSEALSETMTVLADDGSVILDRFREGSELLEFCDRENLEILLRMRRKAAQPDFETLDAAKLSLFLAAWQGLIQQGDSLDDLEDRLDKLLGYPARAALWEQEILPARLNPCYSAWLDQAMRESGLIWFGCGREKLAFAFEEDLPLYRVSPPETESDDENTDTIEAITQFMADAAGKVTAGDIASAIKRSSDDTSKFLWQMAWRGMVTNDDFEALRKGVMNRFKPSPTATEHSGGRSRRSGFNRWKNTRAFIGHWLPTDPGDETSDPLEREEMTRDRARQLFLRYGVLYRELLKQELPGLQWRSLFRTLRLMELSGEIVSGYFFKDIAGVQFCSHAALRFLKRGLPENAVYWMNAADPASLSGLGPESLRGSLPERLPSNHIVYHDERPVIISRRNGSELLINVEADHPRLSEYMGFMKILLSRQFQPLKSIAVEKINGETAVGSPYENVMREFGFVRDYKNLILRKNYQ